MCLMCSLSFSRPHLLFSWVLFYFFPGVCFDKASVKECELSDSESNVGLCRQRHRNVIIQLWVMWVTDFSCACCSKCNTLWLHRILVYWHHRAWRNWFLCLFYHGCPTCLVGELQSEMAALDRSLCMLILRSWHWNLMFKTDISYQL